MLKNKKALFITFEGGEGSGKSTQSKALAKYFQKQKIEYVLTREIGGTIVAERIRELIFNSELDAKAELALIIAARIEHLKQIILPAINSGKHVICDRFIDSTIAYQGQLINKDFIIDIHRLFCNDLWPDITFFMDIHPRIALNRAFNRGNINKYEHKNLTFHIDVYNDYKLLAVNYANRINKINADQDLRLIHKNIINIIKRKIAI